MDTTMVDQDSPEGYALIENGRAQQVQNALAAMMATKMPIPRSMKMAVLRGDLRRQLEAVEDARKGLIERYGDDGEVRSHLDDEGKEPNPAFTEFQAAFKDLMDETFTVEADGVVVVYQKGDGDDAEFFWKENGGYKLEATDKTAEAIFQLLDTGILKVVPINGEGDE